MGVDFTSFATQTTSALSRGRTTPRLANALRSDDSLAVTDEISSELRKRRGTGGGKQGYN